MARTGHVSRRKGTVNFQARLRVPLDLEAVIGKKELTKSLGTSDYREAKKLARAVVDKWEAGFQDLRARRDMTDADLNAAAVEQYRRSVEADLEARTQLPTAQEIDEAKVDLMRRVQAGEVDRNDPLAIIDASLEYLVLRDSAGYDQRRREILLSILQKQTAGGDHAVIAAQVDDYIDRHKLTVEPGSPDYRNLAHHIARGEMEGLKGSFEIDKGNFAHTPTDPLLSDITIAPRDSTTFETIIERQIERNANGVGGKKKAGNTIKKYKIAMRVFTEWRGSARAATVTVQEVEQWRDHLFKTNSRKTVHDKLSTIKTVLNWGNKQTKGKMFPKGFPLTHLELPAKPESDSASKTYTIKQAQKILKAARKETAAHLRWIPWIEAYTGARINEVVPLEKRDVIKIAKDWFIVVRPDEENDRTTKSGKSRKVAIHPDLIKEGFLEFVTKSENGRLFPGTYVDRDVCEWIRDIMRGPKDNNPAPNHGFRHLWEDLAFAKLNRDAALYMAGRASKTSERLYGGSNARMPALAEEMRKFPSLFTMKPDF